MTTTSAASTPVGELLRGWRRERRRSQLDLALASGVSARHLSFVETGRSRPGRGLLHALTEELEVPLRERNALMLAAGYAPAYTETDLDGEQLTAVRSALDRLLAGHEPYPAAAMDRRGDVVAANRALSVVLTGVADHLLVPPVNAYRLSLHPEGLAPRLRNRAEWTAHLARRLDRLVRLTGDPGLAALLREVRAYPGVAAALAPRPDRDGPPDAAGELLLAMRLDHPAGELRLLSTMTTFGAPADVTLAELSVEAFFPADDATRTLLHHLAEPT